MYKILRFAVVCFFLLPTRVGAQEDTSLRLSIQSDKTVYTEGDPVQLTLTLENRSSAPVTIYNPDLGGVSDIQVVSVENALQKPVAVDIARAAAPDFFVIAPGKSFTQKYENLNWFSATGPVGFSGKATLPSSMYRILLKIHMPPAAEIPIAVSPGNVWQGQIVSNIITITVRPPGQEFITCPTCGKGDK